MSEERVTAINEFAFAEIRHDQTAFIFRFSRVVRFEQRFVIRIERRKSAKISFLNPIGKICASNFVRKIEKRIRRGLKRREKPESSSSGMCADVHHAFGVVQAFEKLS